jgi:hypothetical protein
VININEKISPIKKILAYSAIKIKANPNLPYSILNPDTNSDSPSAKSKGVRLVSARHEINQIPTIGNNIIILFQILFLIIISIILILPTKHK